MVFIVDNNLIKSGTKVTKLILVK